MDNVSRKLIQRIREEFEEAPWLRFTADEAARFWGLETAASEAVLTSLSAEGFLVSGIDDRFGTSLAGPFDGCRQRPCADYDVRWLGA